MKKKSRLWRRRPSKTIKNDGGDDGDEKSIERRKGQKQRLRRKRSR